MATKAPAWMVSVGTFAGRCRGAAASDMADCNQLAREAWGDEFNTPAAGFSSFAYMWRRFGPPWRGSDDHKEICCYYVGTPMKGLYLWVSPRPWGIGTGYMAAERIEAAHLKPRSVWIKKFSVWGAKNSDHKNLWDAMADRPLVRRAEKVLGKLPVRPPTHQFRGWRKATGVTRQVNEALLEAMRELLRPVGVRDVAFNILGACEWSDEAAPASEFAGLGVPREAMTALLKPTGTGG